MDRYVEEFPKLSCPLPYVFLVFKVATQSENKMKRICAVVLLSLSVLPALAGTPIQAHKLLPSDGAAGDAFGISVALSGNLALVGAYSDSDNGDYSGSAYMFNVASGGQLRKLLPSDGAAGDFFGGAVALSGNLAVISAASDSPNGTYSGSAYIFDVTTGEQLYKLIPSDGGAIDHFGSGVALSGNLAVISAETDSPKGTYSGSAYVFDVTTGEQLYKLVPSDGATDDHFGCSVALSGNVALIGAFWDDDNGDGSGSAYVFDVTTGEQLRKLLAPDGAASDYFGDSVALSGNVALVGAWDDDNGDGSGSAYVFDVTTGEQLYKLVPSDGAAGDAFGSGVELDGKFALVGAHGDNSGYMFDVTTGEQLYKLLPSDGATGDRFGYSVGLNGNLALVGAFEDDDNGNGSGSAYVFAPDAPFLKLSTGSFNVVVPMGTTSYVTNFTVQNLSASNLVYQISTNASWLSVSPSSGSSSGEVDIITLDMDLSALGAGTHNGEIVITATNAENSPQVINVQLVLMADTIYVSASTGNDSASGFSWDTAKATIQAGVDALGMPGGTVLVSNGVYLLSSEVLIDKPLTLRSVNGPDETIIDAQWFSRCLNLENPSIVVAGFTFQSGFADGALGGAVFCSGSSLLINCVISGCTAWSGGGGVYGGVLKNCVVQNNGTLF
ncbi:MAG: BACON domain-containing protein, partial [Alphaproteobacteria bacterium]